MRGCFMQKQEARLAEYLSEYIETCLEELRSGNDERTVEEFTFGETYAYVECLEIILSFQGADREALRKLELKYGII